MVFCDYFVSLTAFNAHLIAAFQYFVSFNGQILFHWVAEAGLRKGIPCGEG